MGMKNEVVMILVFLVLGLVFLSASNSIVNHLLIGNFNRGTCHDTDGGIPGNEFVKGTVSGIEDNGMPFERTDYCVDAYQLKEYSCDLTTSTNFRTGSDSVNGNGDTIYCTNGCKDGACKR